MLKKRLIYFLVILFVFTATIPFNPQAEAAAPVYRALLIGNSTYPDASDSLGNAPYNDVAIMSAMLKQPGATKVASPVILKDASIAAVNKGIETAFKGAKEGDVSIFYYSGHGLYSDKSGQSGICLISGETDETLYMNQLEAILNKIPGTVVVILDCCNSGGAIDKSISISKGIISEFEKADKAIKQSKGAAFQKSKYKVIAACHDTSLSLALRYFSVFTSSIGVGGGLNINRDTPKSLDIKTGVYGADANGNGTVTLQEMYEWLKQDMYHNKVYSNPQVYPENDTSFAFLRYDATNQARVNSLIKVTPDKATYGIAVTNGKAKVSFSLSARKKVDVTAVLYEEIYQRYSSEPGGAWVFVPVYTLMKNKTVNTGTQTLTWSGKLDYNYGYPEGLYMLIVTPSTGAPVSCLFSVSTDTKPYIDIELPTASFNPTGENNLRVNILFNNSSSVAALTVKILDSKKNVIATLAEDDLASASITGTNYETGNDLYEFYNSYAWNGRLPSGALAPAGKYFVQANAKQGNSVSNTITKEIAVGVAAKPTK